MISNDQINHNKHRRVCLCVCVCVENNTSLERAGFPTRVQRSDPRKVNHLQCRRNERRHQRLLSRRVAFFTDRRRTGNALDWTVSGVEWSREVTTAALFGVVRCRNHTCCHFRYHQPSSRRVFSSFPRQCMCTDWTANSCV